MTDATEIQKETENDAREIRCSLRTHCDAKSICACRDAAYADEVSGRFVELEGAVGFFFNVGLAFVVPADDFTTVFAVLFLVPPDPPPVLAGPPALEGPPALGGPPVLAGPPPPPDFEVDATPIVVETAYQSQIKYAYVRSSNKMIEIPVQYSAAEYSLEQ